MTGAREVPPVQVFEASPSGKVRPARVRYVATSSGPRYAVVGIGRTPEEAKAGAFRAWLRQRRPVIGMGIRTVEAFEAYFGLGVFGPLADGEGASE